MKTAAILAAAVLAASGARGAMIAWWDLDGEPGDQVSTAGSGVANVTPGPVARGLGLTANSGANSINSRGWNTLEPAEDYYTFSLTIAPGWTVDLDRLRIGTRASGTGPGFLGLFYSGDNFTANLYTFEQGSNVWLNSNIDLSALVGLAGTVEFRIIALTDINAGGTGGIGAAGTCRIGNYFEGSQNTGSFHFTGEAIPEPATVSLLAGFGFALALRRRART